MAPESIDNEDGISRWIFFPHMSKEDRQLIWEGVFVFPKGRPESIVWRKYLGTIEAVHSKGCDIEKEKNYERASSGRSLQRYDGAINARVGDIREIKNSRKHGFRIVHDPIDDEAIYHAHILYDASGECDFSKQDKLELKVLLRAVFSDLIPHKCSDQT